MIGYNIITIKCNLCQCPTQDCLVYCCVNVQELYIDLSISVYDTSVYLTRCIYLLYVMLCTVHMYPYLIKHEA